MQEFRRRVLITLLSLALVIGLFPGVAQASSWDAPNNVVYTSNTSDGETKTKARVNITRNTDPTIDNQNYATAYSRCVDCRTVAVAVQVVVHTGEPGSVVPENVAVAVNDECTTCETIAFARQFVVSAKSGFKFSERAEDKIDWLSWQIYWQSRSDDSALDMGAKLDSLYERLKTTVKTDIESSGKKGDQPDEDHRDIDS